MAKQPDNPPAPGDRVKLRGREAAGLLRTVHPEYLWCWVVWDQRGAAPKIVHRNELEKERQQ